jgi:hypothetical protein
MRYQAALRPGKFSVGGWRLAVGKKKCALQSTTRNIRGAFFCAFFSEPGQFLTVSALPASNKPNAF